MVFIRSGRGVPARVEGRQPSVYRMSPFLREGWDLRGEWGVLRARDGRVQASP